ncbi:MAG TPA: hypothetical protein VFH27_06590, partial [Longimicrobiaceae bacterium]|nr:hypothetical protein [Longimicrobiaceae bacterium]
MSAMDRLRIAHLHARYRLAAGAPAARERLDAVLRQVLAEALEHALDRAGVPAHEEICIRHVHAPVRLRLGMGDSTLLAAWSVALADAIRRAADGRGGDVVHYGSRPHARADVLLSAAAGDLRRAWAWRQMGLWREGDSASPRTAAVEAVRALLAEPEAIVPVVRQAARAGALPALAARLDADDWAMLARTALANAGAPRSLARALFDRPPSPERRPGGEPSIASPTLVTELDPADSLPADGRDRIAPTSAVPSQS